MKTLLITLFATLFIVVPVANANAEEVDDVFLDDGGMIDEPPMDTTAQDSDYDSEPVSEQPLAQDPSPDEPAEAEAFEVPQPVVKPSKAVKPTKLVKAPKVEKNSKKKVTKAGGRKTASKEGFRTTAGECRMHKSASSSSPVLITVSASKKIWVEDHNDGWVKAFRKSGHGYLSRKCFE